MENKVIYENIFELAFELKHSRKKIYMTSGGFDPLHIGHLRCIQETAMLAKNNNGITLILVNGDGFLKRKKGKPFMKENERLEIIAGLKGVDKTVLWDDGTQNVIKAIEIISPHFFTKGGDRSSPDLIPEWNICNRMGCEVIFNVGGEKIQSSSALINSNKNK